MLARILIAPFGSPWRLRGLCRSNNYILNKVAKFLYSSYQYENGSSIAWNATILGEPVFPHGMKSIFISGGARIGSGCVIFQQVTIGSVNLPDAKGRGAPVIGDNVYIGAGAKIIGNVKVGNNVRIGANCIVHRDVPDNSVVVLGEQVTLTREQPLDNRFYTYHGGWGYIEDGVWKKVDDPDIVMALNS